jgi:uncharacterized protein YkwD
VLAELNFARTQPDAYAETLRAYRGQYEGNRVREPGGARLVTHEGVAAVDEAIEFLRRQPRVGPLAASTALHRSAADQARDQGPDGLTGHMGADGSSPVRRIERYGLWRGEVAENISYGDAGPEDVVRQLIIDDGVADRGHRVNIFDPDLHLAGVACGPHRVYRHMCVIDFAEVVTAR